MLLALRRSRKLGIVIRRLGLWLRNRVRSRALVEIVVDVFYFRYRGPITSIG